MKNTFFVFILLAATYGVQAQDSVKQTTGEFTDARDGKIYRMVQIGEQVWMAENLAYLPKVSQAKVQGGVWVYDFDSNSVTEAKAMDNYKIYGCLYDWKTAVAKNHGNGKDICPVGWHLPTDQEWKILESHLGMDPADVDKDATRISGKVGRQLKATRGWDDNGGGVNESGFSALPGGCRNTAGYFINLGRAAAFWTSEGADADYAWNRILLFNSTGVDRMIWSKLNGRSVRCVRD
ncbi:MAG: FISUMP domain-containing protein [Bacteroidales bacterium]